MKAIVIAALALSVSSQAMAGGADAEIRRVVLGGQRVRIGHEQSWDAACQSMGASVTITAHPQHGKLSQERVASTVQSNGSCQGAHTTALDIYYTPQQGYQGPDHVSFDTTFGNGMSRHVDANLRVVSKVTSVSDGQVLREKPMPGSFRGEPGTRVFLDDRSCPSGEVKQIVLGNFKMGIPSAASCVTRKLMVSFSNQ